MPIRFRCAYCNQLMGIARRKAGSVVKCPKCAGEIIVPTPEDEAAEPEMPPEPEAAAGGFEDPKFDQSFPAADGAVASSTAQMATEPAPPPVEPAPAPPPAPPKPRAGLFIPVPMLVVSFCVIVLLLILTFVVGVLIGRNSVTPAATVGHGFLNGAPLNVAGQRGAMSVAFQRSHSACISRARSGC